MKLLYCPECQDVCKLGVDCMAMCVCEASWGHYKADGLNAIIGGKAIPLGFVNSSLSLALKNRPESGWGSGFEAFVIPKSCPTIEVKE